MGSLFKLHRLRFKMRSLLLLLAPLAMAATMGSNKGRESRHFWGQNMTVPRSFQNMGSINIAGVGDVYVVTQDPSTVQMVDNGFRLVGGGRVYLAQEAANDFSNPYIYWQAPLLGNHISYTVDVSNVGCHCNSAFYFVQMPGYDSSQNVIAGPGGDYYCDANHVNDNWCPEYDTWEGNRETVNVQLHTCDYVAPNYYPHCDGGGCGTNACDGIAGQYGPGRTIDTNQPIIVSHAQVRGGDGLMSASNTWLNSNGKTADWNACGDSNYVKNMGYSLEGIVAAFSLWGGPDIDMGWLDGCTGCGGTCNLGGSSVTWTNFALDANKNSPNPKVRAAEGA